MSANFDLQTEVESLFKAKFLELCDWCEKDWSIDPKCRHDDVFAAMSDDYVDGYNAGIASIRDALATWSEVEFGC